jgi:hypothetical protein
LFISGSTIFSDEWRAYSCLKKHDFNHFTVCHKKMFARDVETDEGTIRVNTNCIEGFWARVKHRFKTIYGTSEALQETYFFEFVFRNNCKARGVDIHSEFWRLVSLKYNIQ